MDTVILLADKFLEVPDTIWAAIIASILTLSGVLFTNRENRRVLKAQLKYDIKKFEQERDFNLKTEVYLSVASKLSVAVTAIPKMSNLDVALEDISAEVSAYSPLAAKLYLVAKEDTVRKALAISNEIGRVFLELLRRRAEFQDIRNAIDIYKRMTEKAEKEQNWILENLKEMNLQNVKDARRYKYLEESYEQQRQIIDEARNKIGEIEKNHGQNYIEFSRHCMSEYANLTVNLTPFLVALRSELRVEGSDESFKLIIDKAMRDTERLFGVHLDAVGRNKS